MKIPDFTFFNPQAFYWFIPIVLVAIYLFFFQKQSHFLLSSLGSIKKRRQTTSNKGRLLSNILRLVYLSILVICLADPGLENKEVEYNKEAVDIMLAIDISGSMYAEDFHPKNRLTVAKEEATRFIDNRRSDRIGLVIFAKKSFTQCPLTFDHQILKGLLDKVSLDMVEDGTAIGLAIANATKRLLQSDSKSKVIILLTDGENNSGKIDPLTAAEIAKTKGIKIYTIGVGKGGLVPFPQMTQAFGKLYRQVRLDVDEDTLKKVAAITGGLYFRARDQRGLKEIYKKIDDLEKTEVTFSEFVHYNPLYQLPLFFAFLIFVTEFVIRNIIYLKLP